MVVVLIQVPEPVFGQRRGVCKVVLIVCAHMSAPVGIHAPAQVEVVAAARAQVGLVPFVEQLVVYQVSPLVKVDTP